MHSGYHNVKLDEQSSYLIDPTGNMFQRKIDEIFKNLHDVFDIVDDISVVGYASDGKDYDDTLQSVLEICRQVNLKLNKGKHCFKCT